MALEDAPAITCPQGLGHGDRRRSYAPATAEHQHAFPRGEVYAVLKPIKGGEAVDGQARPLGQRKPLGKGVHLACRRKRPLRKGALAEALDLVAHGEALHPGSQGLHRAGKFAAR